VYSLVASAYWGYRRADVWLITSAELWFDSTAPNMAGENKKARTFNSDKMVVPLFNDEELAKLVDAWDDNNFPAAVHLIMHNQKIINDKLTKIMKHHGLE